MNKSNFRQFPNAFEAIVLLILPVNQEICETTFDHFSVMNFLQCFLRISIVIPYIAFKKAPR